VHVNVVYRIVSYRRGFNCLSCHSIPVDEAPKETQSTHLNQTTSSTCCILSLSTTRLLTREEALLPVTRLSDDTTIHSTTHYLLLEASPLGPYRGLSRRALSVPFFIHFSVLNISLCAAYEPAVANLCVVCGHHSHSAGWTTASAASRYGWTVAAAASASTRPASQVNRR